MNVQTKRLVYDEVTKKASKALSVRVLLGFIGVFLQMQALAGLPMVLTSISSNTVPLITGVLAYCILKEKLKAFEIVCLLLSMLGVSIMIFGTGKHTTDLAHSPPLIAYVALCLNPIISALVTILLRTMSGISHHCAAFYHCCF